MKKLLALIKTKGKSKKKIVKEVHEALKRKKIVDGNGQLNIIDKHNHQKYDKLNSKN